MTLESRHFVHFYTYFTPNIQFVESETNINGFFCFFGWIVWDLCKARNLWNGCTFLSLVSHNHTEIKTEMRQWKLDKHLSLLLLLLVILKKSHVPTSCWWFVKYSTYFILQCFISLVTCLFVWFCTWVWFNT